MLGCSIHYLIIRDGRDSTNIAISVIYILVRGYQVQPNSIAKNKSNWIDPAVLHLLIVSEFNQRSVVYMTSNASIVINISSVYDEYKVVLIVPSVDIVDYTSFDMQWKTTAHSQMLCEAKLQVCQSNSLSANNM